jgi:hypothetical protein
MSNRTVVLADEDIAAILKAMTRKPPRRLAFRRRRPSLIGTTASLHRRSRLAQSQMNLDERLAAHATSLAARWCGDEHDPYSDIFVFRADGFVLTVVYVEHGMDDGADGWAFAIGHEPTDRVSYVSRKFATGHMAMLESWPILRTHPRATRGQAAEGQPEA